MIDDGVQVEEQVPDRRIVFIEALDGNGDPAGAEIAVFIDGAPAGVFDLGTGAKTAATLEFDDPLATVTLHGRFFGQAETIVMHPGQQRATFQFQGSMRYAVARRPMPVCPDGSNGYPCVICRANGKTWRMCC